MEKDMFIIDEYSTDDKYKEWSRHSMRNIISKAKTKEELDQQLIDFNSQPYDHRHEADHKAMELYGMDNQALYDKMNSEFLKKDLPKDPKEYTPDNAIEEEVQDNIYSDVIIDYTSSDIEKAENWAIDAMRTIITPTSSLEALEDKWVQFNSQTYKQKRESDWKCIEIFGIDNKTFYEYLKSKFLKKDIEVPVVDDEIEAENLDVSFIEQTRYNILEETDLFEKAKLLTNLSNIKTDVYSESLLIQNTLKDEEEYFKDNICNTSNDILPCDLPILTPSEMDSLGVFSGQNNKYSINPDSLYLDDGITTKMWYEYYKAAMKGLVSENGYSAKWVNKLKELYYDYDQIKESGDIEKINARKQSILELGWNPELNFDLETRLKANERIRSIYKSNNNIIDISSFKEDAILEDTTPIEVNGEILHPVYIVLVQGNNLFSKAIKAFTKGPFSHAAIGFDHNLKEIYSYNLGKEGRSGFFIEGRDFYDKDTTIAVYAIFVKDKYYGPMKRKVQEFIDNINNTRYSILNIPTLVLGVKVNMDFDKICSQFVDSILKVVDIDLVNKDSSLVTPNDFYRATVSNKAIYKLYQGKNKNYKPNKVLSKIHKLKAIPIKEVAESYAKALSKYIIKPIHEVKEFPVQFDTEGNLLIKKINKLDFEAEYAKSHKLLMSYEKSGNLEGMKYELSKLWFMNTILEKHIYSGKLSEEDKKLYTKARAKILNDFNKYLDYVNKHEKDFNFEEYYEQTPFSDAVIKVNSSTLKYTIEILKKFLIPKVVG